ncbi:MAG TPA: hypothetical protein VGJ92_04395, partial [Methanocella sp.]
MTELHAFRPVSTAFEKTRKLLLEPFDIGAWIRLILITFLVGTGTASFNPGSNLQYAFNGGDVDNMPAYDFGHAFSDSTLVVAFLLIIAAALLLVLIMAYLRGVFSFVQIDALSTGNVRIVRPFKENMGRGFKVFVFNIIVTLISLVVIGAIVVTALLAILGLLGGGDILSASTWNSLSTSSIIAIVAVVLAGLLAILVYSIFIGLFVGFFYDFGVPLMFFRNMGLRQSIRQVWKMVKTQPLQFFVYVVVRWVIELAIMIVLGIVYLFVLAIFIAVGFITAIAMLKAAETSLLLALPFALALILGLLVLVLVSATISMPVQVYLRYYSLDFL